MKYSILITAVLALALAACSKDDTTTPAPETAPEAATPAGDAMAPAETAPAAPAEDTMAPAAPAADAAAPADEEAAAPKAE